MTHHDRDGILPPRARRTRAHTRSTVPLTPGSPPSSPHVGGAVAPLGGHKRELLHAFEVAIKATGEVRELLFQRLPQDSPGSPEFVAANDQLCRAMQATRILRELGREVRADEYGARRR